MLFKDSGDRLVYIPDEKIACIELSICESYEETEKEITMKEKFFWVIRILGTNISYKSPSFNSEQEAIRWIREKYNKFPKEEV